MQPAPRTPAPATSCSLPVELAEHLLLLVCGHEAESAWFDPQPGSAHRVAIEDHAGTVRTFVLPAGLGDVVVARLGLLADLDLTARGSQAGTARVQLDEGSAEVVVTIRKTELGLGGELRLLDPPTTTATQPADEIFTPGSLIGPYQVIEVLGQGGMGVVYEAEHTVLGRRFAVKVLFGEVLASDPASARRFVREARAAARLNHPGIVDVTDFGNLPDGRTYLVMERLPGRSLGHVLAEAGALEPLRALRLVSQAAEALRVAHAAGVHHCDLTPHNIFVLGEGPDERIVLLDFGSATTPDPEHADVPRSPPGMVTGTPHYMPPEVIRGLEVDGRADIYALGVIFFEMLTGKVPYDGSGAREIVVSHLRDPIPRAVSPIMPLPDALHQILGKTLAKEPARRIATVAALLVELAEAERQLQRPGWRRWLSL